MNITKTIISTIFHGADQAYIYLWISKSMKLVYVGQTNEKLGTYGRGNSHLQKNGNLRINCKKRLGIELEDISDLILISYSLPKIPEFLSIETSYRLSVEYLVQFKLYDLRTYLNPIFKIISNVTATDRVNNSMVKQLANIIVSDFIASYDEL